MSKLFNFTLYPIYYYNMEATEKFDEIKIRRDDSTDKCPKFGGKKEEYLEWKGKAEDWMRIWRQQKVEGYPGFRLRAALTGELWTLVAGLSREQLASEKGVEMVLDILDQKYGTEQRQQKIRCLDEFLRVEKEKGESIQDYVSRFDMMFRKCLAVGIDDLMNIYKGGVLLTRAHIEKVDKWVLMAAIGEDVSYEKVKSTLLSLFGEEEVKKEKEVWITGKGRKRRL